MNKQEFLNALSEELRDFSAEERTQALQFYAEYFDEAGPENEQQVLQELGSPHKVAQILRANCPGGHGEQPSGAAQQAGAAPQEPLYSGTGACKYNAYQYTYPAQDENRPHTRSSGFSAVWIILLIISSPIWLSLAAAAFAVLVSLFAALFAVAAAGIATLFAGIWSFFAGIRLLFALPSAGLLMTGLCLLAVAAGIVICLGCGWCIYKVCVQGIPFCRRAWHFLCEKVRDLF